MGVIKGGYYSSYFDNDNRLQIIDNLTATIVCIKILQRVVPHNQDVIVAQALSQVVRPRFWKLFQCRWDLACRKSCLVRFHKHPDSGDDLLVQSWLRFSVN